MIGFERSGQNGDLSDADQQVRSVGVGQRGEEPETVRRHQTDAHLHPALLPWRQSQRTHHPTGHHRRTGFLHKLLPTPAARRTQPHSGNTFFFKQPLSTFFFYSYIDCWLRQSFFFTSEMNTFQIVTKFWPFSTLKNPNCGKFWRVFPFKLNNFEINNQIWINLTIKTKIVADFDNFLPLNWTILKSIIKFGSI